MSLAVATSVGGWWGFAEANKTVVGVAVVAVAVGAVVYLGRRLWRSRRGGG